MYSALELIKELISKIIHSAILVKMSDNSIVAYNSAATKLYPSLVQEDFFDNIQNIEKTKLNKFIKSDLHKTEFEKYSLTKYLISDSIYLLIENKGEIELSEKIQSDIILNSSNDLIIISDDEGIIKFISENCDMFIGFTKDEVINTCFYNLLLPGELERLDKYAIEIVNYGKPTSIDLKFKHKDGRTVYLDTINSILPDDDPENNKKYLSIARDITEKKREENLFKARLKIHEFAKNAQIKEILQKTLDEAEKLTNSNIGFYHFVDEESGMLELQQWSTNTLKTFCKLTGHEHLYQISQAGIWTDCLKTRQVIVHNDYQSLTNKKGYPEGHAHVIRELVVPVIRKEKIVAILGIGNKENFYNELDVEITQKLADMAWDIAELKLKELELDSQKKKFQAVFNNAPIGMALVKNRIIVDMNDVLCELLKTKKEDAVNKGTEIFYKNSEVYNNIGELLKNLISEKKVIVETKIIDTLKNELDVIMQIGNLDGNNLEDGVIVSLVDITDRKAIENKFRSNVIELKQKSLNLENLLKDKNDLIQMLAISESKLKRVNEEKDKFFSVIAHDLRSPFQGLLGLSQILFENYNDLTTEEVVKFSGQLSDSAKTLYSLLENLLQWSRIKRGMILPAFTALPLIHIVNECASLLKSNMEIKKQEIEINILESIYVNVDFVMFNSIMRNLLTNAIKFSYLGGKIKVAAKETEENTVQISVSDSGVGINEDDLNNLFKIDKKVSQKGTMNEPSTGLGLILCKEYIEIMGGKIWATSSKKDGTTFNIIVKSIKTV